MDLKFLKINFLIIGIFFVCILSIPSVASAKNLNVNVSVYTCDNNGICDLDQAEDYVNCPNDCPVPICNNNGICESNLGEDEGNCYNDCHIVPTTTTSTHSGLIFLPIDNKPPIISHISVFSISRTNANISWDTNELAYCQLDWGDSNEYSGGSIAEVAFFTNHSTEIPNLNPGTNYYFQIFCYDRNHNLGRVTNEWFATLPLAVLLPKFTPVGGTTNIPGKYPISPIGKPSLPGVFIPPIQTTTLTTGTGGIIIPERPNLNWEGWTSDMIESIYWPWPVLGLAVCVIWWCIFWKKRRNRKERK